MSIMPNASAMAHASDRLRNPGKSSFLKLATDSVRAVNLQRDGNGITYARKAMVRPGMSLNLNGRWEEGQFFYNVQEIVAKHREYINGTQSEDSNAESRAQ